MNDYDDEWHEDFEIEQSAEFIAQRTIVFVDVLSPNEISLEYNGFGCFSMVDGQMSRDIGGGSKSYVEGWNDDYSRELLRRDN